MADSITANYDFVKPEVGASGNTWGGKTNANWDSIDTLIASLDVLNAAAKATPILADKVGIIDTEADPDTVKTITLTQIKNLFGTSFADSTFEITDDSDATKKLKFQLSGFTTATTRTVTWPNMDGTVAFIAGAQTFTDKTLTAPILTDPVISKVDNGAVGAKMTSLHDSTTPAAADVIWEHTATSKDSAANTDTMAQDRVVINDPTSGSEDSVWERFTRIAGTLARRFSVGGGLWMEGATGGDPGAGKINAVEVQKNGAVLGLTSATAQATTSGTNKDFTIPAWAKRAIVQFVGVGMAAGDSILVQLGTGGGIQASGYVSASGAHQSTNTSNAISTDGFVMASTNALIYGEMSISLADAATNSWVEQHGIAYSNLSAAGGGGKVLPGVATTIRVTSVGGTAFNAGLVNILYEG